MSLLKQARRRKLIDKHQAAEAELKAAVEHKDVVEEKKLKIKN